MDGEWAALVSLGSEEESLIVLTDTVTVDEVNFSDSLNFTSGFVDVIDSSL